MNKMLKIFLIVLAFYLIIQILQKEEKKDDVKIFGNANFDKIIPVLSIKNGQIKENNFIKKKVKGHNHYTLNSIPNLGTLKDSNDFKFKMMTIFTDKPLRNKYDIPIEYGMKLFIPKLSKYEIKDKTPNVVLNFVVNGEVKSFVVTLTYMKTPFSNTFIEFMKGNYDDHELKIPDKTNIFEKLRDNLKSKLEFNVKNKNIANQLTKIYGDNFMDYKLRSCRFSFTFINKNDENEFEHLMKNHFNDITNLNLLLDCGWPPSCWWKAVVKHVVAPVVKDVVEHPEVVVQGLTLPGVVAKKIGKSIVDSCDCPSWDSDNAVECTVVSKALTFGIEASVPEADVYEISGEMLKDALTESSIKSIEDTVENILKQHGTDSSEVNNVINNLTDSALCAASIVECVVTKICQYIYGCSLN